MKMGDLLDILAFATLHNGESLHEAHLTIEGMAGMKGRHSPTVSCNLPPVYVEQGSAG